MSKSRSVKACTVQTGHFRSLNRQRAGFVEMPFIGLIVPHAGGPPKGLFVDEEPQLESAGRRRSTDVYMERTCSLVNGPG